MPVDTILWLEQEPMHMEQVCSLVQARSIAYEAKEEGMQRSFQNLF